MIIVKKILPYGALMNKKKVGTHRVVGEISWEGPLPVSALEELLRALVQDGFYLDNISVVPTFQDGNYGIRISGQRPATVEEIDQYKEEQREQRVLQAQQDLFDLHRLLEKYPDLAKRTPVFDPNVNYHDIANTIVE